MLWDSQKVREVWSHFSQMFGKQRVATMNGNELRVATTYPIYLEISCSLVQQSQNDVFKNNIENNNSQLGSKCTVD